MMISNVCFTLLAFSTTIFAFARCDELIGDEDNGCIDNYQELKEALLNNSGRLLLGFYPPNQSPSRVLNVYYDVEQSDSFDTNSSSHVIFEDRNVTTSYIFQWVDSSTLLLTEIRLFQALSFGIASLSINDLNVTIPPFCDEEDAVPLLNLGTIWLKSYATGTDETDRFYAQYYNGERFEIIGSDIQDTTVSLLVFEYIGSVLFSALIYFALLLNYRYVGWIISEISLPCLGFLITVIVANIEEYHRSYRFSDSEWLKALPVPIIFPVFAVINIIVSTIMVLWLATKDHKDETVKVTDLYTKDKKGATVPGTEVLFEDNHKLVFISYKFKGAKRIKKEVKYRKEVFPLPAVLQVMFYHNTPLYIEKHERPYTWVMKIILQIILLASTASFAAVMSFHYIWVSLAFSAYPVRSIASLAFVLPFVLISAIFFLVIEVIGFYFEQLDFDLRSYIFIGLIGNWLNIDLIHSRLTPDGVSPKHKVYFGLSIVLVVLPVLFVVIGILYFYSQALIDVNDSENNPVKTVLAAIIPTFIGGALTYLGNKVFVSITGKKHGSANEDNKAAENMEKGIVEPAKKDMEKGRNEMEMNPLIDNEKTEPA